LLALEEKVVDCTPLGQEKYVVGAQEKQVVGAQEKVVDCTPLSQAK
jgi:hypothetical protein